MVRYNTLVLGLMAFGVLSHDISPTLASSHLIEKVRNGSVIVWIF